MIPLAPRNSTCYKIAGTETFRLASSKILKEWGGNLQNVEKGARKIYVADSGYQFIQVDQAGAEALIVAYLSPKGQYRTLFEAGIKPHTFVALHVFADVWRKKFKKPEVVEAALGSKIADLKDLAGWKELDSLIKSSDNWPSDQRYYYLSKKVVHASSYGMRRNTFVLAILKDSNGTVVLDPKVAENYLAKFHNLFPEIGKWHQIVQNQIKKDRVLRNLFGYPRLFTGYMGDHDYKECYAFVPQSTVGTITNIAFSELQEYIEENKLDWHLLANTHDSYMFEVPAAEVEHGARIGRFFMEKELIAPDGTPFRMRSEVQAGYNWAPFKKQENEYGLKEVV